MLVVMLLVMVMVLVMLIMMMMRMMMMSCTSPVKLSRCPVFIKAGCDRYNGLPLSYDNPALMRLELCPRLTLARVYCRNINLPSFIAIFLFLPRVLEVSSKIDGV